MQKAKVACAAITFRQNVLQDEPQECHTAERAAFSLSGLAVLVTERHPPVVAGQNIFLLYHAPIQITPQIDQGLFARADFLTVHYSIGRIITRQFQLRLFDYLQHLGAKYFRQCGVAEQIVAILVAPPPLFFVECGSRHYQMHMRMVVQPAIVRVQHDNRTGGASEFFVVLTEGIDGLPRVTCNQVIHHTLVVPGQRTELGGQGERHHKVMAGNQLL
jgi:hypothetical protein